MLLRDMTMAACGMARCIAPLLRMVLSTAEAATLRMTYPPVLGEFQHVHSLVLQLTRRVLILFCR